MMIKEMAEFIRTNKPGINYPGVHMSADTGVVLQYTRHMMGTDVHITDEHIFECCEKAESFDEHVALCKPIARIDEEQFQYHRKHAPVAKGRTRRRWK